MTDWHVRRGDKVRGPFSEPEVFELIGKRQLQAGDYVDAGGAGNWWPIEQVPTFARSFASQVVQHVYYQAPQMQHQGCRSCGETGGPIFRSKMTSNATIAFWVMLFFCFPFCWIPLLMKERVAYCRRCNCRL